MANPLVHSKSSVKRWGGEVGDYLSIHELLDSPKATMNNNSSRLLTHNTWFAYHIIPKIFGYNITNSDGKSIDNVAFSYCVLEYLQNNSNNPEELTVNQLKNYVEKRVEEITNGKQQPTSRQETMEVDWRVR